MFEETQSTERRKPALVAGALSLGLDLALTSIDFFRGDLEEGRGTLLDPWDLVKVMLAAFLLLYAASKVRSRGLVLFAAIFALIGAADYGFAHDRLAEWLVNVVDLGGLGANIPGDSAAWIELVILTVFAAVVAVLIWVVTDTWDGYKTVRRSLTVLLGVLVVFAIGVDLLADLLPFTEVATLVEETGERFTLSVILGYVTGIAWAVRTVSRADGERGSRR